jgi:hypothetical protein
MSTRPPCPFPGLKNNKGVVIVEKCGVNEWINLDSGRLNTKTRPDPRTQVHIPEYHVAGSQESVDDFFWHNRGTLVLSPEMAIYAQEAVDRVNKRRADEEAKRVAAMAPTRIDCPLVGMVNVIGKPITEPCAVSQWYNLKTGQINSGTPPDNFDWVTEYHIAGPRSHMRWFIWNNRDKLPLVNQDWLNQVVEEIRPEAEIRRPTRVGELEPYMSIKPVSISASSSISALAASRVKLMAPRTPPVPQQSIRPIPQPVPVPIAIRPSVQSTYVLQSVQVPISVPVAPREPRPPIQAVRVSQPVPVTQREPRPSVPVPVPIQKPGIPLAIIPANVPVRPTSGGPLLPIPPTVDQNPRSIMRPTSGGSLRPTSGGALKFHVGDVSQVREYEPGSPPTPSIIHKQLYLPNGSHYKIDPNSWYNLESNRPNKDSSLDKQKRDNPEWIYSPSYKVLGTIESLQNFYLTNGLDGFDDESEVARWKQLHPEQTHGMCNIYQMGKILISPDITDVDQLNRSDIDNMCPFSISGIKGKTLVGRVLDGDTFDILIRLDLGTLATRNYIKINKEFKLAQKALVSTGDAHMFIHKNARWNGIDAAEHDTHEGQVAINIISRELRRLNYILYFHAVNDDKYGRFLCDFYEDPEMNIDFKYHLLGKKDPITGNLIAIEYDGKEKSAAMKGLQKIPPHQVDNMKRERDAEEKAYIDAGGKQ